MEKRSRMIYWIVTGLFAAFMLMNVVVYIVQNQMVSEMFTSLGYPTYLVYPLALAKLLGVIAIVTRRSAVLKEWAYAGFFFNFILAAAAHAVVGDGGFVAPIVAIIILLASRHFDSKVFGANAVSSEPVSKFEAAPSGAS